MTDTVLVLAWVLFAHLVADFVLQNDWIAIHKGTGGREGWGALAVHGFHVGLCLLPFALAYGPVALAYIAIVVGTHVVVDRWKVQATRRAERAAVEAARRRLAGTGAVPGSGLGPAWTPWPGMLFLADQVLHVTIALVGWLVLLQGRPLEPGWIDAVNTVLRDWDRAAVHALVLTGVILVSLFLVNTRAAYYFVLALVSPRDLPDPAPVPAIPAADRAPAAVGYTVRVGPIVATVEPGARPARLAGDGSAPGGPALASGGPALASGGPALAPARDPELDPVTAANPARDAARAASAVPSGAPAQIGATIGALERLLIVAFVLAGAEAAVGFVIAAKTIARFKQLDDRGFAEYYLLGTLASVSVAFLGAVVARAALATIP